MTNDHEKDLFRDPSLETDSTDSAASVAAGATKVVPNRHGCGCVIKVLLGLMLLFLAVTAIIYYVVMHTSLPLSSLASAIEAQGASVNLRLTGISGSISSGISIQSMKWDDGEVADVRVKYNGILDILFNQQLILREVHIGKAHFNVGDLTPNLANPDGSQSTEEFPTTAGNESPLKLFQIDRLSLNDIEVKNDASGFRLSIPSILWTGFKMQGTNVEFGNFTADSDRLKIETTPSTSAEYQRRIKIIVFPKLHPKIRQPINLAIEFGHVENKLKYRLKAFEDNLDIELKADQSIDARCLRLNLDKYFEGTLPQELTVETVTTDVPGTPFHSLEIRGGTFKLGQGTFVISARMLERCDEQNLISFTLATCHQGNVEIDYVFTISRDTTGLPQFSQQLVTNPPTDQRQILALLFYGKPWTDLNDTERNEIDKKSESFGSPKGFDTPAGPADISLPVRSE